MVSLDDSAVLRRSGAATDPLLLVLHGYGANERDLVPLLPHLGHLGDAAFLRAPLPLGPSGWMWFPIQSIGNPDVATVRAAADALVAWLDEHAAGREVIAVGFSQGSTVALQVLRQDPTRLRAVVVLSGFVADPGTASDGDAALIAAAERGEGVPVFFGHGSADPVIPPAVTAATSAWLAARTALVEREYPGLPHAVDAQELADVRDFLRALPPGTTPVG